MSLNSTPSGERIHIGFFGLRNAGKSSVVNAVTGQKLSVVSDVKGTTTDPVRKAMELLPLGPVVIIDTPGIDDEGSLGLRRVERAKEILATVNVAVLVVDASLGLGELDRALVAEFKSRELPYVIAYNKADLASVATENANEIAVSALTGDGIHELKELIAKLAAPKAPEKPLVSDLVEANDVVILVVPIDSAAPKGRLILPQQQVIRDLLEKGAMPLVCRETELTAALASLAKPPKLVITDSQVFGAVNKLLPAEIPLTSFSILFARYKGDLAGAVAGANVLDSLEDGDKLLISEGCTHHRQCGDIGTVKLPNWIKNYTKKELTYEFTSGGEFPSDLSPYKLVIHCGGCTLTAQEMQSRVKRCRESGVPLTNYGIAIAKLHGILDRAYAPLK